MKFNTVTIGKTNTIIVIITNAKKKKKIKRSCKENYSEFSNLKLTRAFSSYV